MDVNGKVAFVTGGSGVIGAATARALGEAGCDVCVSFVGMADAANDVARSIEAMGRRSFALQLDQRDPESITAAIGTVIERLGGLDVLVNNAAWNIGIPYPDLDALTLEVWDRLLETNLRGPYLLTRAAAPYLRAGDGGKVINVSSAAALTVGGSSLAYSTSKSALMQLTRCLAKALAPEVTVNCVAPGLVEGGRMTSAIPERAQASKKLLLTGQPATADDIAAQVLAFCHIDPITGQVVVVDGGLPGAMVR